MADHNELIAQFCDFTGASPEEAQLLLRQRGWDLESATTEYFLAHDDEDEDDDMAEPDHDPSTAEAADHSPSRAGVGRTLGGSVGSNRALTSKPRAPPKGKFATLGDLTSSGPSHAGHDHSDDDSDEDFVPEHPDLFAGGEKSGLAVQNPNAHQDLQRQIIEKAKRAAARPDGNAASAPRSRFTGPARTLGGDDVPSQEIPDPAAGRPRRPERVERHLHFWEDGFSVDDGELYPTSDPENARILAMIRAGRAPLNIMNVTHDQEVDVKIEQHEEKYVAPPKKYKPFGSGGQRLGSPVPGVTISTPTASQQASSSNPSTSASTASINVDESLPAISLQIRLGDGTRLVSRFNTSHTIGDVYAFVDASSHSTRSWVLMTTFPSKELSDKEQVLGDLADFKRGGVVVQKWT